MADPYKNLKIFLCGIPGSGKSITGRMAARMLRIGFIDLDETVELKRKKSITEIFKEDGEDAFRRMEVETLAELARDDEADLIALGGGALESDKVRESIRDANGVVIWLKVSPDIAGKRLEESGLVDSHPLLESLRGKELVENLTETLERRKATYEASEITFETDSFSPVEVASAIYRAVKDHVGFPSEGPEEE